MSIEFNSRFVALLEAERQRFAFGSSREQTGSPDSLLVRKSGDGLGGRFFDPSKVARRETGQGNMGVSAERT